jgi:hypothetical protein
MDTPRTLLLDFLAWLDSCPRTYLETMDAWRTSCPRLPVWEDAVENGFVARVVSGSGEPAVVLTARGSEVLHELELPV